MKSYATTFQPLKAEVEVHYNSNGELSMVVVSAFGQHEVAHPSSCLTVGDCFATAFERCRVLAQTSVRTPIGEEP